MVRVEPGYPPPAERRGIERWVQVQFSVTRTGRVTDVIVVDASPRGVFDEASIEAVRRWLYNPKIEDGVAVERIGLQTVFRYRHTNKAGSRRPRPAEVWDMWREAVELAMKFWQPAAEDARVRSDMRAVAPITAAAIGRRGGVLLQP